MRSGSDYAERVTTMLRPRQDFPTPLFKLVVPLTLALLIALAIYLVR